MNRAPILLSLLLILVLTTGAIAQSNLPDPNSSTSIGWVVVILLGLATAGATIASAVSTIRYNNRPVPSIDSQFDTMRQEAASQFEIMRREAKEGRAKIHNHIDAIKNELQASIKTVEADVRDHDRKIVALETKVWGNG